MRRARTLGIGVTLFVACGAAWIGIQPALAGGGCYGSPPTDEAGRRVAIVENCFQATVLRVDPGTTVTWTNQDSYAHTVTGVGGLWGTADSIKPNASVSFPFPDAGVYVYACLIHPGMVGAVVVGNAGGSAGLAPGAALSNTSSPPAPKTETAVTTGSRTTTAIGWAAAAALAGLAIGTAAGFAIRSRSRASAPDVA